MKIAWNYVLPNCVHGLFATLTPKIFGSLDSFFMESLLQELKVCKEKGEEITYPWFKTCYLCL